MKAVSGLKAFAICVLAGAAAPATGQQSRTPDAATWFAAYHRDARIVPLPDGRSLNLYCTGTGSPTVILESGIAGAAYDWRQVQARVAAQTRVCSYDRAGMGRSPAGPLPRDTRAEVADLEALLPAAEIRPPYVLVGHSMGGYNVRLFASRHPQDVAGLLLVDPSVEDQIPRIYAAAPAVATNDRRQMTQLRACANAERSPDMAARCTRSAPDGYPSELAVAYVAGYGLTFFQTILSEAESLLTVASWQVRTERRPLGAMPLIVLTRSERSRDLPPDQAEAEWTVLNQMHSEVAALSTAGSHRVVEGAGHAIQDDRPEAVVAAISEVIAATRGRR